MMRSHQSIVPALILALAGAARGADEADDLQLHPVVMTPSPWRDFRVTLDGYLRVRGDLWNDLDLSRGSTPTTGQTIWPTPAGGGGDHTLQAMDMRLRLEPTIEIGQAARIHVRADVLDNVGYGSTPDVSPSSAGFAAAAQGAAPPERGVNALRDPVRVKQAWGEVILPFGIFSAGRMGPLVSWGTGFFVNNGDCFSCDRGDTGDRVALTLPLWSHFLTLMYELSASGPYVDIGGQSVDLDPRAHVDTWALAFARWDSPEAQRRKLREGRTLLQYGLLASYRAQDLDAPAWTRPGGAGLGRLYTPNEFVQRDLHSFAGDLWFLLHRGGFRAELELAMVVARIADATNTPGVSLREEVTALQLGGVLSLAYSFRFPLRLRLEVGAASGDDAPGFGVRSAPGQLTAQRGDLDGPQLRPPSDMNINNFRFHPDYRVDLILWRRIVGQVSDAVYVRPSVRVGPFGSAWHRLSIEAALVASNAIQAATPPGQERYLGLELDVMARYRYEAGFEVNLAWGVFIPGAGFRNLALGLDPQPAQTVELILLYRI